MEENRNRNTEPKAQEAPQAAHEKPEELHAAHDEPYAGEAQPVTAESAAYQVEQEAEDDFPARPGRSKKWYIVGGLLVVFLAAAAFLGARLLRPQSAEEGVGGNGMMVMSQGGPGGGKSVRIDMEPAKELPQDKPTTNGIFVRRDDQSIFVGTGNIQVALRKSNGGGGGNLSSKYDGPVVEVVTNHQTKIYHDASEMPEPDKAVDGVIHTQQVVEEGSLDDLGDNMLVTVWGEKQGDRYIANVILYR